MQTVRTADWFPAVSQVSAHTTPERQMLTDPQTWHMWLLTPADILCAFTLL
jgi:hypothetical protein